MSIRLFVGHDQREAVGSIVFAQSVFQRCRAPVAITRLSAGSIERDGTNSFTYQRFLVPWLCDFKGFALFMDGADMLLRADLQSLYDQRSHYTAVQIVQHDYHTRALRKYIGTPMESANEDYPRKNWSSVMLWNCAAHANKILTPEFVAKQDGSYLHRFGWIQDETRIGALPPEWNVLIGETDGDEVDAKLAHYTLGIPAFDYYRDARYADEWWRTLRSAINPLSGLFT